MVLDENDEFFEFGIEQYTIQYKFKCRGIRKLCHINNYGIDPFRWASTFELVGES